MKLLLEAQGEANNTKRLHLYVWETAKLVEKQKKFTSKFFGRKHMISVSNPETTAEVTESEMKTAYLAFNWLRGGDEEDGLEVWRALHERYEPRTIQTGTSTMTKVFETAKTDIKEVKKVPSAASELTDQVRNLSRFRRSRFCPTVNQGNAHHNLLAEAKTL